MSDGRAIECVGWAAIDPGKPLVKYTFVREPLGAYDCELDIICCGVCHSDIHLNSGDWEFAAFPKPQVIELFIVFIHKPN